MSIAINSYVKIMRNELLAILSIACLLGSTLTFTVCAVREVSWQESGQGSERERESGWFD